MLITAVIAAVCIIVDRLSKVWAVGALPLGTQDGPNLGVVRLTMVHNQGAAFGIGEGMPLFFVVVAAVILAILIAFLCCWKDHGPLDIAACGLIAGGAVGNAVDRVLYGYVIDYFDFTFVSFPVFNVADICVVAGVVLFMVYLLFFADFGEEEGCGEEGGGR